MAFFLPAKKARIVSKIPGLRLADCDTRHALPKARITNKVCHVTWKNEKLRGAFLPTDIPRDCHLKLHL
jgi:hypothetical protein